jgi:acyl dehydratase/CBS domain-containing protein
MLVPIPVAEVATPAVETVGPETTVRAAARRLHEAAIGSLVVVADGDPVGIVTERDLTEVLATETDPDETVVESVMSTPLVTVDASADLDTAVESLEDHGVKKLVVLEDGALAGIVTTTDLSYYIPRLRNPGAPVEPDDDADTPEPVSRNVRPETAYERPEWRFEYVGGEDGVSVGDSVRFSKPLTDEDVRAFADVTGDTNRLHLDDAFASETRFGRRIVHGSLTTGVISAALARLPGLTIYISKELQFLGPLDVGERVAADCRVVEDLGGGRFRLDATVGVPPAADAGEGVPPVDDEDALVSGSVTVLVDDAPEVAAPDGDPPGASD